MNVHVLETIRQSVGPACVASIRNDQLDHVKAYIQDFTKHPFSATRTGIVLDTATDSQGKMIRPRLVLMAASYGPHSEREKETVYKVAAIVEMTHLASLIHDDIVDDAPLRRGKPSVQGVYGKHAAVYAGDFIMSRITYHLMREGLNEAGMVLANTVEAMCAGEIGQSRHRYDAAMTIDQYKAHIHGKTAALFMACCRLGALVSGCSEVVTQRLEGVGECLGYMFQMRDDLLDFSPDSATIGKASQQDFREGIYTMPVLLANEHPGGNLALRPYFEKSRAGTLQREDMERLTQIVTEFGGMERAWQAIAAEQAKAERLIQALPANPMSHQLLRLIQKVGSPT